MSETTTTENEPAAEPQPAKSRRRRGCLRFSLRAVMIFIILLCLFFAWFGAQWRRYQRQEAAVTQILQSGGEVRYDYQYQYEFAEPGSDQHIDNHFPSLTHHYPPLSGATPPPSIARGPKWLRRLLGENFFSRVTYVAIPPAFDIRYGTYHFFDADVAALAALSDVQGLCISGYEISDEAMRAIGRMTQLRLLDLNGVHFPEDGMRHWKSLEKLEEFSSCNSLSGPDLPYLKNYPRLQFLSLNELRINKEDLTVLQSLPHLRFLDLSHTVIDDEGLAALRDLPVLERLDLVDTPITDAGLVHLSGLVSLRRLDLGETAVTDEAIAPLQNLTSLTFLNLSNTHIGDKGLVYLENLSALETLWLDQTAVSDAGLVHLRKRTSLVHLSLDGTVVDDAGLTYLRDLTMLQSLGLEETALTDAGLLHLQDLPALVFLRIGGTQVTPGGIGRFKAAMPRCNVQ